jgi:hypothetical protein
VRKADIIAGSMRHIGGWLQKLGCLIVGPGLGGHLRLCLRPRLASAPARRCSGRLCASSSCCMGP